MKRFILLLISTCCLSAIAAESPEVDIPFQRFTLENGLRVVVHEDRKAPVVAIGVWYHVGSKDEKPGRTGFAHLFEHLMYNGSENYDDEFFKPFQAVGATNINGTTWFDRTNYFETVPTTALDMALWMESDRMGHLLGAVTQEKLDNQRGVVQNEKRQRDNQPYGKVEYQELEGLFPEGHPYRWSTIGSMEDLDAASLDDVHAWFKAHYGAANTVIALAGDINAAEARPLLEKYFGNIEAGPPLVHLKAYVPERSSNTREQMQDRVPQARIYRSWVVPGRTKHVRTHLDLAAEILGTGKNSRLYKTLVYDTQLAVDVAAEVEAHEIASIFRITVTIKPGVDIEQVHGMIDEVLADFISSGPKRDELQRAQTMINAAFVRGVESVGGMSGKAGVLAMGELYAGDPGFFRTYLGWLNETSRTDVQKAAATWLQKAYHQVDVVPYVEGRISGQDVDRSAVPAVDSTPDLLFPEIERDQLGNGIGIVLAQRHTVPVVEIAMQFDAGYAADAGRKLGTASFTLDMLNEGTKKRSALDISAESDSLGAIIDVGSNLDVSWVSLSALKNQLGPSLDLFADIIRNPAFAQDEIDRLRPRILAQIEAEKNQPVSVALRTLPPLIYGPEHAYGIPFTGSGTSESVAALGREDFLQFQQDWLRPDNATLFVAGDTTMSEIKPLLEKQFGAWQAPATQLPVKKISDVALPSAPRVYLIDKPGAPQSLILAGHVAPPTGVENNIDIETMNNVLGGNFTARVNMNLREDKGWAYYARTVLVGARAQRPYLVITPVQTDRTVDALKELTMELEDYPDDRPTLPEELDVNVKNSVRSLPGQYETAGSVLGALMSNQRFGRPDDYVMTLKEKYEGLTTTQVDDAARQVVKPDSLIWLVVGDLALIEQPIRDMGIGEVITMESR